MPPSDMTGTSASRSDRGDLRHAHPGDDPRRADGARPDADLDGIRAGVNQRARRIGGCDVAGDHLLIAPAALDARDHVYHATRVPVRSVDHHYIDPCFTQSGDAIERVGRGADGGPDPQASALILAGAREFRGLLKILDRNHAHELMIAVDDQHLLDAMPVQEPEDLRFGRVLAHRDEALLRSHDGGDRRVELLLKAQVAVRDNADHFLADHDRHA